jgi:hypothetical protein
MPLWHRIKSLWQNLAGRQRVEQELDAEIRSYQAMLEDEKTRAGAHPPAARREALLDLGGAEQIKEQVRDVRAGATLEAMAVESRMGAGTDADAPPRFPSPLIKPVSMSAKLSPSTPGAPPLAFARA